MNMLHIAGNPHKKGNKKVHKYIRILHKTFRPKYQQQNIKKDNFSLNRNNKNQKVYS